MINNMKKYSSFLVLFFLIKTATGQVNFQLPFNDTTGYAGNRVVKTSDGGFLIGTNIFPEVVNNFYKGIQGDGLVVKTDSLGNVIWANKYQVANSLIFDGTCAIQDIEPLADGGAIILGLAQYGLIANRTTLIFRIDVNGNLIWSDGHYSSNINEMVVPISLIKLSDSTYVMGAQRAGTSSQPDTYITHYDSNGMISSQPCKLLSVDCGRIIPMDNKEYLLLNRNSISVFDSLDQFRWGRVYSGSSSEINPLIIRTQENGFLLTFLTSPSPYNSDLIVIKADSTGNVLFGKMLLTSKITRPVGIAEFSDKGFLITTLIRDNVLDRTTLIRFDSLLNLTSVVSSDSILPHDFIMIGDDNFLLSGNTWNPNIYEPRLFLWKSNMNYNSDCNFFTDNLSYSSYNPSSGSVTYTSSISNVLVQNSPGMVRIPYSLTSSIFCNTITNSEQLKNLSPENLIVFPNPVSTALILKNLDINNGTYKITDLYGTELMNGRIKGDDFSISVDFLIPGLYLIEVAETNKALNKRVKKFLVVR